MADGTPTMHEISQAIREGANAFLKREFSLEVRIALIIASLFGVLFSPWTSVAFLIGSTMSALAALVGMKAAVIYNERVACAAMIAVENGTEDPEGVAGKVAIRGGSVSGLAVGGFAMLGLLIVYLLTGIGLTFAQPENLIETSSFIGLKFVMFPQILVCYSLGCSLIAVFNRLGGGIYTKGADMGSDLVGKLDLGLEEDDPRNAAVIADCVGDNVGDIAGNSSDLLESTIGAIVSCAILPIMLYTALSNSANSISSSLVSRMMQFPIAFVGLGLTACVLGILYVLVRKSVSKMARTLNLSLWTSAGIIAIGSGLLSYYFFGKADLSNSGFKLGWYSPWASAVVGIIAGIMMGQLAERYTSDRYKETKRIASLSQEGPALVIVGGLSSGWRSCLPACCVLGGSIILSSLFSGLYGSAMAAVGMLSFVVATVSVDSYGPISDNAGGIAEMSKLKAAVRKITDSLDSLGNTTAAIGKGFAIGSGVLAALAMMMSFTSNSGGTLDITNFIALGGAFVGVGLMHWLSGAMLNAVCDNAAEMVQEVRRQVYEHPGILDGSVKPNYSRCIDICTHHALKQMVKPILVSLLSPVIGGILFGPLFVAGLLIGTILDSVVMATSTANSGGAWDNAKKLIRSQKDEIIADHSIEHYKERHKAAVIGDTVGDPFKDVVGPNQDIMIKMMATLAVIMLPVFQSFNLLSFFI